MPTLELTTPTIETNATTSNVLTTAVTVSTESTEISNLEIPSCKSTRKLQK